MVKIGRGAANLASPLVAAPALAGALALAGAATLAAGAWLADAIGDELGYPTWETSDQAERQLEARLAEVVAALDRQHA